MEIEVDSLKQLTNPNLEKSDFDEMIDRYYDDFKKEWESYKPITIESLYQVEDTIKSRLKTNPSYSLLFPENIKLNR